MQKSDKTVPRWNAPDTLLPRVMQATSATALSRRAPRVTLAGMVLLFLLCACTGGVMAVLFGIIAVPSVTGLLTSLSAGFHLLMVSQRLITDLFIIIFGNTRTLVIALIYCAYILPAGLCGMAGLVYLFLRTPFMGGNHYETN